MLPLKRCLTFKRCLAIACVMCLPACLAAIGGVREWRSVYGLSITAEYLGEVGAQTWFWSEADERLYRVPQVELDPRSRAAIAEIDRARESDRAASLRPSSWDIPDGDERSSLALEWLAATLLPADAQVAGSPEAIFAALGAAVREANPDAFWFAVELEGVQEPRRPFRFSLPEQRAYQRVEQLAAGMKLAFRLDNGRIILTPRRAATTPPAGD